MNTTKISSLVIVFVLAFVGLRMSNTEVSARSASNPEIFAFDHPESQDLPDPITRPNRHNPEARRARLTTPEMITQAFLLGEINDEQRLAYLARIGLDNTSEDEMQDGPDSNQPADRISGNPGENQRIQPATLMGDTILYLPVILKAPVSGRVTDNGAPAASQDVVLRYYDGLAWSTYATATTDESGFYLFGSAPPLDGDQSFYVRWDNTGSNTSHLSYWICIEVTVSSPLSANTCNFDIKDIPLVSPAGGSVLSLPQTFTWTPRGISGDSYELVISDIAYDKYFETYPALGNVNSYSLSNRPAGFSTGVTYYWGAGVRTPYGWGESYFSNEFAFSASAPGARISGRVTYNGNSASGQSLLLRYYNGSSWTTYVTTTTDSNGNYSFTNLPLIDIGQVVYVRWDNPNNNTNRLWIWQCYQISVESFIREYTCNFDLKNIPLVSPSHLAMVALPTTFNWTTRGFTGESYEFDLFDPADGDPYFYTPLLGNNGSYTLTTLPVGFSPFVQYGWDVWVATTYDGAGESYYFQRVTFTNSGISGSMASVNQMSSKLQGWPPLDSLEFPRP